MTRLILTTILLLVFVVATGEAGPIPTMDFDKSAYDGGFEDVVPEFRARVRRDQGRLPFSTLSNAVIFSPQLAWAYYKDQAELEFWTDEEFESNWQENERLWEEVMYVWVYLYGDDIDNLTPAGDFSQGRISRAILTSSEGDRQIFDDFGFSIPETTRQLSVSYNNTLSLEFSPEILEDDPEWLRLYLIVGGSRVMFEWEFDD